MLGTFLSKQRLATNGKFSANRRREEDRNVARKGEWSRERYIVHPLVLMHVEARD